MNHPEADQIASAISMIRPDWLKSSLMTLLAKHKHRSARDVMLALVWCAYDPATDTPGRINADGPWWDCTRLAGTTRAETPPPYQPPRAEPTASPETIRALRAQHPIRRMKEEPNV